MTRSTDELLNALLDGELTGEEQARVERQLAESLELRQLYEELRALRAGFDALPQFTLGPGFAAQIVKLAEAAKQQETATHPIAVAETSPTISANHPVPAPHQTWLRWSNWISIGTAAALVLALYQPPVPQLTSETRVAISDVTRDSKKVWNERAVPKSLGLADADDGKNLQNLKQPAASPAPPIIGDHPGDSAANVAATAPLNRDPATRLAETATAPMSPEKPLQERADALTESNPSQGIGAGLEGMKAPASPPPVAGKMFRRAAIASAPTQDVVEGIVILHVDVTAEGANQNAVSEVLARRAVVRKELQRAPLPAAAPVPAAGPHDAAQQSTRERRKDQLSLDTDFEAVEVLANDEALARIVQDMRDNTTWFAAVRLDPPPGWEKSVRFADANQKKTIEELDRGETKDDPAAPVLKLPAQDPNPTGAISKGVARSQGFGNGRSKTPDDAVVSGLTPGGNPSGGATLGSRSFGDDKLDGKAQAPIDNKTSHRVLLVIRTVPNATALPAAKASAAESAPR